ncbi:PsaF/MyfF family fimbrial adhesin regulatory protein [Escherichia coli]|nr:PsaF/MyfF family fimbrial adhesin regulatory protein [Escherichia coli]
MKTKYVQNIIIFFCVGMPLILFIGGGVAGKDVYSFEKKYNQGNLVEKIDIVIENGAYNVGHYISDEKDRLLLNEKIYGIHLYLPDNKHVFIPIKFKVYQGYDTGASLDSQGGVMITQITQHHASSVLFFNERGVANLDCRMYTLGNLLLGSKIN